MCLCLGTDATTGADRRLNSHYFLPAHAPDIGGLAGPTKQNSHLGKHAIVVSTALTLTAIGLLGLRMANAARTIRYNVRHTSRI